MLAGGIEIAAGVGVALKPRFFATYCGVVLHLICNPRIPGYFDVALRDLASALGALAWEMSQNVIEQISRRRGPA